MINTEKAALRLRNLTKTGGTMKIISALFILLLVLIGLAGCGHTAVAHSSGVRLSFVHLK